LHFDVRYQIGTMTVMTTTANEWIASYAAQLRVDAPSQDEIDQILALAATAAHGSERTAAPVACWLAAKAGLGPDEARELALLIEADSDTTPN
jgi:anti-sigma factor ChrR (cupin superfamily)